MALVQGETACEEVPAVVEKLEHWTTAPPQRVGGVVPEGFAIDRSQQGMGCESCFVVLDGW